MTASLRALLAGLLDYAGLFPPAALPMAEAVTLYATHRRSASGWMLARFICPAVRLEEFEAEASPHLEADDGGWPLSLLGRPGESEEGYFDALRADLDRARTLAARRGERLRFEAWETKLPTTFAGGEAPLLHLLERSGEEFARRKLVIPSVFLEVPASDPGRVQEVAGTLARHNGAGPPFRAGLKIRTGGLDASAFPSPAEVAAFVIAARDAGVSLKATAGLHHPVRRFANELETKMHGFLNLFGGAALARSHGWGTAELTSILEEEDPSHFQLDEKGLEWDGYGVDLAGIHDTRTLLAVSFGSCSFDEPVEDLEALGFLHAP